MTKRQAQHATSEQLSLLADSDLPVQFRLDRRTRERGLAHIAAIRRQLAGNATGATRVTDDFADHHQHRAA
jgi:hypothetical protein